MARFADHVTRQAGSPGDPGAPSAAIGPRAPCPAGSLPDQSACIPVPLRPQTEGDLPEIETNQHHDRLGRLREYEHIPRRPEKPADYRLYRFPVEPSKKQSLASSGYDLDRPDGEQRRGNRLKTVGHAGIDLSAPRGTPVALVRLLHQEGDAEVLYVGDLFGTSVITRHVVREAGTQRDYIVIHGHLERARTGLKAGDAPHENAVLGFVGDTGSPGDVHLHFEVRRVRDGVSLRELGPRQMLNAARSIATDPRNVLELLP